MIPHIHEADVLTGARDRRDGLGLAPPVAADQRSDVEERTIAPQQEADFSPFEFERGLKRKRFRMIVSAVAFGAVAWIVAIAAVAFAVVDQRALQSFRAEPRTTGIAPPPTDEPPTSPASIMAPPAPTTMPTDGAVTSPRVPAPLPGLRNATGETKSMPDTVPEARNMRKTARHGTKKHARRSAPARPPEPNRLVDWLLFGR